MASPQPQALEQLWRPLRTVASGPLRQQRFRLGPQRFLAGARAALATSGDPATHQHLECSPTIALNRDSGTRATQQQRRKRKRPERRMGRGCSSPTVTASSYLADGYGKFISSYQMLMGSLLVTSVLMDTSSLHSGMGRPFLGTSLILPCFGPLHSGMGRPFWASSLLSVFSHTVLSLLWGTIGVLRADLSGPLLLSVFSHTVLSLLWGTSGAL